MNIFELDAIEKNSIREFVELAAERGYFNGTVLDYGCGKQPYRKIIEAGGGVYYGFDQADFPGNVSGQDIGELAVVASGGWGAILCTQVLQYMDAPWLAIQLFREALARGGNLLITFPTTWPEIRDERWRFTELGMREMLRNAGFQVESSVRRAVLPYDGFELAVGYGMIAW